jgi:hypothetical protein
MDNNPSTVPPAPEGSGEGENVGQEEPKEPSFEEKALQMVNEATGRNYPDLETAQKAIKDTYSFVGDDTIKELKTKAQEFDKMKKRPLEGTAKAEEFYSKVDKMEFLLRHPDAEPYADIIGAIARDKGISWFDAYESSQGEKIKAIVEKEKKEKEAESPSFVESGQRLPEGKMAVSAEEFKKLPLEEQKKIVEKLPQWGEKIPRGILRSTKT